MPAVKWSESVADDDFEAGRRYLELLYPRAKATALVGTLKSAPIEKFAAKDVLRASELHLLPVKEPEVAKQFKKIAKRTALSPLLLVRESGHARLIVADGFHRLCAVMHIDPASEVACKIG